MAVVRATSEEPRQEGKVTEQPKLYTPEEMAVILRVTKETVYDRIRAGTMPKRKIGRRYYFTQEDLDSLLSQQ